MAGEKILVVEDSAEFLRILAEDVLPMHGFEVLTAATGEEGINKLCLDNPELVLLDLELPDMSGLEIVKAVQEARSNVPIILMTAYGSESLAVEAFHLGVRDYMIKPFTPTQVKDAIERALNETRLRRENERLLILSGVGKTVVSLMDLEELLSCIVEAGVYVTDAEEGFLLLVDPESNDLYLRAGQNLGEAEAQGFRLRVEDSLAGQVVQTGKPIRRGGRGTGRDFKVKTGYYVKSLLHVPLLLRGKVIGVLSVDNQMADGEFSEDDEHSLSALADYAAISIENATLYHELRKRMDDIRRSQRELIESSKLAAVGTLAAGVAHEFNNLLAAILGHAQLGLMSDDVDEIKEALSVVVHSVDKAKWISSNLLAFSRREEPVMELADVTEAVENPLRLMEGDLQRANIEIVRKYSAIPPIVCDTSQISQVSLNLLTNARDAMFPKGGTLTVEIRRDPNDVVIAFTDTGSGVPDHVMDRLFEPFVTTKGPLGGGPLAGTGLGLSVSYGIVKNHGGTIEVQTRSGKGSTFTVRLPLEGVEPEYPEAKAG
ncbi:MAG: response regulator [Anaerolineae bacterium]|nr:response regulator [Anaerolineae bacterium]NIN93696.1 response regulator [Anaerolineae bacterium]NIQ76743.1 response regulator [Anaerolineae bacterium]